MECSEEVEDVGGGLGRGCNDLLMTFGILAWHPGKATILGYPNIYVVSVLTTR